MKKIKSAPTELVMFDFDGTLVDTAPDIVSATNRLLIAHGHKPLAPEVIRKDIGTGLKKLIVDFFPEAESDPVAEKQLMAEFLRIYREEYLKSPYLFPGAEKFLKVTAPAFGLKIAIVSNKREELIHPILEKLKLHTLPWIKIIGGDTYATMKPDALPLRAAMEAAHVAPESSLIVGDGTPDIEGAINAGCRSIAVSFGYSPIEELLALGAFGRIDHFDELASFIDRSNA